MKFKMWNFVCFVWCFCYYVDGLNILGLFPHNGRSHHFVIEPLINSLANKGHQVTIVSQFPPKDAPKTRKDIVFSTSKGLAENLIDLEEIEAIPKFWPTIQSLLETLFMFDIGIDNCEEMLKNNEVQKLIESGIKFDVALVEQFNSDCVLGVTHKLNISSIVGITSDTLMPWHFDRISLSTNPSFVPCHALGHGNKPTFLQTLDSLITCSLHRLLFSSLSIRATDAILKRNFGEGFPALKELINEVDLILVNSYFPVQGSFPSSPNFKEVGGLYLKNSSKLPEDIQEYIDTSPHGVIYFSMGSMIRAVSLSAEKLKALQDTFSQLPQRVLWKWENETMAGMPDNVMVRKWLPQFDILNHKNVKAFISHGGMLSTTEAAHCGVPMVSIPLYGDQFANAAAAKASGLGTVLLYGDITKETMLSAIQQVLSPEMQASAARVSRLWRDRPMSPLDSAVYWVEHVARHGGAHLRPAHAALPLHRYLLLDVAAFLLLLALLACYISYTLIKMTMRLFCGKSKKIKTQ